MGRGSFPVLRNKWRKHFCEQSCDVGLRLRSLKRCGPEHWAVLQEGFELPLTHVRRTIKW